MILKSVFDKSSTKACARLTLALVAIALVVSCNGTFSMPMCWLLLHSLSPLLARTVAPGLMLCAQVRRASARNYGRTVPTMLGAPIKWDALLTPAARHATAALHGAM